MTAAVQIILPTAPLGSQNAITSVADLRAVDSTDVTVNTEVLVAAQGFFRFDPSSLATDNGTTIIKPADRTTLQAGRWIMVLLANAGLISYGDSTVEAALNVTPEQYGAIGGGVTDDHAALQAAIDSLPAGGTLLNSPGVIYRCTVAPDIKDGVTYNLNGGGLLLTLTGVNDTGVRLRSNATLCNGSVTVQSSGSSISAQASVHAPVTIGAIQGAGGTVGAPSVYDSVSGWVVRDLVLSSNKSVSNGSGGVVGSAAIAISGGPNNGLIENIEVPDSSVMYGGVMMDANYIGTIVQPTSNAANAAANKAAFPATLITTHPHGVRVRGLKIGALTAANTGANSGSYGVRLSGCYDIAVDGVEITSVTQAAFYHTAGDLGFEYAPVLIKPLACKNNRFTTGSVVSGLTAYLIYADSYADNIATAISGGYTPLMPALIPTNLVFQSITGTGPGDSTAQYGCRAIQLSGAQFIDIAAAYYKQAFNIDTLCNNIAIRKLVATYSREHGVFVDHAAPSPQNILIEDAVAHDNGQSAGTWGGITIGTSRGVTVLRPIIGVDGASDSAQDFGLRIATGAVNWAVIDGYLYSTAAAGVGWSILSGTEYNSGGIFRGNRNSGANINVAYAGLDVVPYLIEPSVDGRVLYRYKTTAANAMVGLTVRQGEFIEFEDAVSAGFAGRYAVGSATITGGGGSNLNTITKTYGLIS